MKSSLKKILALVLVLAMAMSVVACSKPAEDSSTPDTTPTDTSSTSTDDSTGDDAGEPYTITVSLASGTGVEEAWQAVADAYMAKNPNATVVIDLKPSEGYSDWARTVAADYKNADADIVAINTIPDRTEDMMINWNEYMEDVNPYDADGKIWKETFNYEMQTRDSISGKMDNLSLDSVQVAWFYNKDIFAKVGVEAPKTWDELVDVCEKIYAAGYQPISVEGNLKSFYEMRMGWLARCYGDQTYRLALEEFRAQPGDYCYDPDVDGKFVLDVTDPWNDAAGKVHVNPVRWAAGIKEGKYSADCDGYRTIWTNFKKVFPQYAGGDAFFGCTDCMPAFYRGEAAMILHTTGFAVSFARDMKKIAAGEGITFGEGTDNEETATDLSTFELGMFNMPNMTGAGLDANTRTIEVATGFIGAFSKNAEHDAKVVDFMQFYTSAEGFSTFAEAGLANDWTPGGACLVYGVEYPADIQSAFEAVEWIGNVNGQGSAFARGLCDNPQSTQEFYDLAIQLLQDKITVDDYCVKMKEQHLKYWPECYKYTDEDLAHPELEPTEN